MHLHGAKRQLLFTLDEKELAAKLAVQRREAGDKLDSWRLWAFNDLLPKNATPNVTNIVEAQNILDEHANNGWLKIWTLRSQLRIISIVILFVLAAIVALSAWAQLLTEKPEEGTWRLVLGVTLFGILGASFSGALAVADAKAKGRIPEQMVSNLITLMRLALGGASAIAAFCFLQAKMIQIAGASNTPGLLAVSFIAGFSEFLVITVARSFLARQGKSSPATRTEGTKLTESQSGKTG